MNVFTISVAVVILAILFMRRLAPVVASVLGLLLAGSIGTWGVWVYQQGQGIALLGYAITRPIFLTIVAVWMGMELFNLQQVLRRRRRHHRES